MESVRVYLLRITIASLSCGILASILGKKGLCGRTVKFLCGIVVILTVIGPLVNIQTEDFKRFFRDLTLNADAVTSSGQEIAINEYADIINDRVEAYILDKAESLGAKLTVEVTLSEDMPLVPCSVKLSGTISPYARKVLSDFIAKDLGINAEEQQWTG